MITTINEFKNINEESESNKAKEKAEQFMKFLIFNIIKS